ncbi:MAG TPA: hypothetical protein VFE91_02790, partial [Nitrososphaerales archaeon]|nr:hypothetical protein [Nitrososphaerales archaeon]
MASRGAAYLVLILMLAAAVFAFVHVDPAYGSTGLPVMGVTDTDSTQPSTFTASTSYVNVTAGTDQGTTNSGATGFFAIGFGTFGGSQLVTFSGTQFSLYLSQDGFSQISPGDIRYAGPNAFSVADLTSNAGWHKVAETNGTFYIGQTTGGEEVLTGPMPLKITNVFKYVKIFDGSAASVAVGAQAINIEPGIALSPASGPAGATVTLTGGGFAPSSKVDLAYSFVYYPWSGASSTHSGNWTTAVSTGTGTFTFTSPMIDAKQTLNPTSGTQLVTHVSIMAKSVGRPHTSLTSTTFVEDNRGITGVKSLAA